MGRNAVDEPDDYAVKKRDRKTFRQLSPMFAHQRNTTGPRQLIVFETAGDLALSRPAES